MTTPQSPLSGPATQLRRRGPTLKFRVVNPEQGALPNPAFTRTCNLAMLLLPDLPSRIRQNSGGRRDSNIWLLDCRSEPHRSEHNNYATRMVRSISIFVRTLWMCGGRFPRNAPAFLS